MMPFRLNHILKTDLRKCIGIVIAVVASCGIVSGLFSSPPLTIQESTEQTEVDDAKVIETMLLAQAEVWNAHDIEAFMESYWNSEEMTFSGGGKTRRGWQATLDSYKKSYPGEKMGKLHFDGLEVELLSPDAAFVLGFWHLDMAGEKKDGNFTLVLKKLDGEWKIIHDHSSTDEPDEEEDASEEKE